VPPAACEVKDAEAAHYDAIRCGVVVGDGVVCATTLA
jgi:hypothetical protein